MSASTESAPRSASENTVIAVNSPVSSPISNEVPAVTSVFSAMSAKPKPSIIAVAPFRTATTAAPGVSLPREAVTAFSIAATSGSAGVTEKTGNTAAAKSAANSSAARSAESIFLIPYPPLFDKIPHSLKKV